MLPRNPYPPGFEAFEVTSTLFDSTNRAQGQGRLSIDQKRKESGVDRKTCESKVVCPVHS
uniref:Uncharacterized protein n=1 Tax=Heterorhabditis bacteriophora TaxID=37862 RepID=A0A1I7WGL6_HETBA